MNPPPLLGSLSLPPTTATTTIWISTTRHGGSLLVHNIIILLIPISSSPISSSPIPSSPIWSQAFSIMNMLFLSCSSHSSDFLYSVESGLASSIVNLFFLGMSVLPHPPATTTTALTPKWECLSLLWEQNLASSIDSLFSLDLSSSLSKPHPPLFRSSFLIISNRNPLAGSITSSRFNISNALRLRYELLEGPRPT